MTSVLDKVRRIKWVRQYQMVQRLVSLVPYDLSVAFVVNPSNFEKTSFGTLVAENRGINARAFVIMQDASDWLQQQE